MMGLLLFGAAMLLGLSYLVLTLLGVKIPWGNPTLVMLISLFSGIQLLSLGVMGEYIGRIYDEVKRRPLFIVESMWGFERDPRASDAHDLPGRIADARSPARFE
jgi:dolichol-phosphate mannosyltransferase